jgi:hypothetical protein
MGNSLKEKHRSGVNSAKVKEDIETQKGLDIFKTKETLNDPEL